jgi:hypothetical protein
MKKLFPIIVILVAFASCKVEKTELLLNLEQGETYHQVMSSKITMGQDINGQHMDIKMTIAGKMAYLVKSFEDSLYNIEVTYESLSMEMEGPQGKLTFSSEIISEDDMVSKMLSTIKDVPFTIEINRIGKIKSVKGIAKLFDGIFDSFPEIPKAQLQPVKEQLMQSYGEEAFKGNFEMATYIFPDRAVVKGDQWKIETNLMSGISAIMKTDYTFIGSEEEQHMIHGVSVITPIKNDNSSVNIPVTMELSGTMTSDIKIDKESGWIVEAKIFQDLSGIAHMQATPQMPEGMSFPMTMKSETVISDK